MSDIAQTVKQQADIVKVIGEYVRLKKAGAQNYSGLCPFHKEKSPSFSVHASRQFFHCFGCGQSGDVFTFVQKIENVGFGEAIRIVAQKCGIALPKREFNSPEEAAESRLRGRLIEIHEAATAWFEEQLATPEGALAREYLAGRGTSPEAVKRFRIGYAPESFNALRDRLRGSFDEAALRASGLFSWKEQEDGQQGQIYSRFRKRITFPICNEGGRVIAFTARALESGEKAGPKYMNSPETPLYQKGQVLYNLDKARTSIREQGFALLVEGQMDCISVFMGGMSFVLATSGTAFTEQQVNLLRRYTTNVVVNFDPDTAGATAAEKSIVLLTEEGFSVRVVTLEGGLDPDRFIRERGIRDYAEALRTAERLPDYLIGRAHKLFPGKSGEAQAKALNYLLPHIRRVPGRVEREAFAQDAAQKLGIDSATVREELRQAALKRQDRIVQKAPQLSELDRILLRALCAEPGDECFDRVAEALDRHPLAYEALTIHPMLMLLRERGPQEPMAALTDQKERALLALALLEEREAFSPEAVEAALEMAQVRHVERQLRYLRAEIAEAERKGDTAAIAGLTQQKLQLDRELRQLES